MPEDVPSACILRPTQDKTSTRKGAETQLLCTCSLRHPQSAWRVSIWPPWLITLLPSLTTCQYFVFAMSPSFLTLFHSVLRGPHRTLRVARARPSSVGDDLERTCPHPVQPPNDDRASQVIDRSTARDGERRTRSDKSISSSPPLRFPETHETHKHTSTRGTQGTRATRDTGAHKATQVTPEHEAHEITRAAGDFTTAPPASPPPPSRPPPLPTRQTTTPRHHLPPRNPAAPAPAGSARATSS